MRASGLLFIEEWWRLERHERSDEIWRAHETMMAPLQDPAFGRRQCGVGQEDSPALDRSPRTTAHLRLPGWSQTALHPWALPSPLPPALHHPHRLWLTCPMPTTCLQFYMAPLLEGPYLHFFFFFALAPDPLATRRSATTISHLAHGFATHCTAPRTLPLALPHYLPFTPPHPTYRTPFLA